MRTVKSAFHTIFLSLLTVIPTLYNSVIQSGVFWYSSGPFDPKMAV